MNKFAYLEENIEISERFELVSDRVKGIVYETTVEQPFRDFFIKEAQFLLTVFNLYEQVQYVDYDKFSLKELEEKNEKLYGELKYHYEERYLNPAYAHKLLGEECGKELSWLAVKLRNSIVPAMIQRLSDIVIYAELFVEIYNIFENSDSRKKDIHSAIYWFEHDYSEVFLEHSLREMLDENCSVYLDIVMNSDLDDDRYLYRYGRNITENEKKTRRLLQTFSEEEIEAMSATYTEGYRKGFELAGKDLSKKGTVEIRYAVGFERMIRAAVRQFEKMGLHAIIRTKGVETTPVNRQYLYDHQNDEGLFLDKNIVGRRLEVTRNVFEKYKEQAAKMAGPAVLEIFGEDGFTPVNKPENITLTEKQQKLNVEYNNEYVQIYYQYIPGEERSFTIIAYPVAEIGSDYEQIFRETMRINNLDPEIYGKIQDKIIQALDQAEYVIVRGKGENCTDMKVNLHELKDPQKQTNFENCLADVNIPLGEVFTSPVLTGTEGILNVSRVYLNGLKYINLKIWFKEGKTYKFTCDNFETEEENQKFIRENLLYFHESLPIGEFAIGTNTTAYVMADKYDIVYKMPILIVEKMGPHFAVGDTCYSHEEEEKTYNPDGKEIIAKENEISALRKEDMQKAYFGCHTDITIPYEEIGEITAVCADGRRIPVIQDGRFVLAGTEELNKPFDEK